MSKSAMTDTLQAISAADSLTEDRTNAERQARWRARQKGEVPPAPKLKCVTCGIIHTGARGAHCSRCWEKQTPEGRAFKRERVAATRARKRQAAAPSP